MTNELLLLILVTSLLFLILEVASVMLSLTGLDRDTARFQAISIITASGYTTSESELVARHPIRRKIAMFLMISGTIALAFIISILVRILGKGLSGPEEVFLTIAVLLGIYIIFHNPVIAGLADRYLEKQLTKQSYLNRRSAEEVLKLDDNFSIAEVHLSNFEEQWNGKTLAELRPRD